MEPRSQRCGDSTFVDCRWDTCGSQGKTGANIKAAVSVTTGGAGNNSNNVHFTNCTWESCEDRSLEFLGTGSGVSSIQLCYITNAKIENQTGTNGTVVKIDWCTSITFRNLNIVLGAKAGGVVTPADAMIITNSNAVLVDHYFGVITNTGGDTTPVRTLLSLQGGNDSVKLTNLWFSVTQHPTVAALEFSGTNTKVDRQTVAFQFDGPTGSVLIVGDSTLTNRFENSGQGTVAAGVNAKSPALSHNLVSTPIPGDIVITPLGTPTTLWVNPADINATTFKVTINGTAPGGGVLFGWRAVARR